MGTRNRFNPCHPCCGVVTPPPTCLIAAGWECDVKNGIVSDDVTGWAVVAGTWNATQTWESGSLADTLTTTSSDARISCDTQQSLPLNDRLRVLHWIRVTNAADEAVILLAGFKVVVKSGSVAIEGGGGELTSRDTGIGLNAFVFVRVCTWYDEDATRSYLGVEWTTDVTHHLVAEVTLGTDGTTEFGTDSVTGSVSFQHPAGQPHRDGNFYHNTVLTDGSDLDCTGCSMVECGYCPGGDVPHYITVAISGLTSPSTYTYHTGFDCTDCEEYDGSYVFDMHDPVATCDQVTSLGIYCSKWLPQFSGLPMYFCFGMTVNVLPDGAGWKLRVTVWEVGVYWIAYCEYGSIVQSAIYEKSYTSNESCTDIDDDLELVSYTVGGIIGCNGFDNLAIHAVASE